MITIKAKFKNGVFGLFGMAIKTDKRRRKSKSTKITTKMPGIWALSIGNPFKIYRLNGPAGGFIFEPLPNGNKQGSDFQI